MAERTTPAKKDVARALLLRGSVLIHLDPRQTGVRVPPWLTKQPQLALCIGLDLPVPIPDLRVDDAGISGTLSFNRSPFLCVVPWRSVFALVGDDGMAMAWPEDFPEELAAQLETAQLETAQLETAQLETAAQLHPAGRLAAGELSPGECDDELDGEDKPHHPVQPVRPQLRAIEGGGGAAVGAREPAARPPYLRRVK